MNKLKTVKIIPNQIIREKVWIMFKRILIKSSNVSNFNQLIRVFTFNIWNFFKSPFIAIKYFGEIRKMSWKFI